MRGWPRTARRMRRRVLLAAGVALVATVGCRSVPGPTGDRVLLIGIDAATWDVIRPLAEAGRLPTLARLVAEGWSAPLRSMEPRIVRSMESWIVRSPWASVPPSSVAGLAPPRGRSPRASGPRQ